MAILTFDDLVPLVKELNRYLETTTHFTHYSLWVLSAVSGMHTQYFASIVFRYLNSPNPIARQWANYYYHDYVEMSLRHLREDGTAWN